MKLNMLLFHHPIQSVLPAGGLAKQCMGETSVVERSAK